MSGYLYILSNPAFPALLKVGQTSDSPEQRIRQLNSTGVPFPFLLEACFRVENPKQAESVAHKALEKYRSAQNREFFEIDSLSALQLVFETIAGPNFFEPDQAQRKPAKSPIPKAELEILQRVVSAGSTHGIAQWKLCERTPATELEVEVLLSNLEHKKFIKCNRRNTSYGPAWLPTTKGIKFLSDNNLIEDWMRRS